MEYGLAIWHSVKRSWTRIRHWSVLSDSPSQQNVNIAEEKLTNRPILRLGVTPFNNRDPSNRVCYALHCIVGCFVEDADRSLLRNINCALEQLGLGLRFVERELFDGLTVVAFIQAKLKVNMYAMEKIAKYCSGTKSVKKMTQVNSQMERQLFRVHIYNSGSWCFELQHWTISTKKQ